MSDFNVIEIDNNSSPFIQVSNPVTSIVEVAQQGLKGSDGSSVPFTYQPPSASATWTIVHNRNSYPAVVVTDSNGVTITPDITYLDANILQVLFAYPVMGTAHLN